MKIHFLGDDEDPFSDCYFDPYNSQIDDENEMRMMLQLITMKTLTKMNIPKVTVIILRVA